MKARNDEQTRFWASRQRFRELLLFTGTGAGACNLGCRYCFLSHRGPRTVIPAQVLRDAIDFLREYATGSMRLHFFGYEPTTNWDLIVAAREYAPDISISMTTNGYLLDDKRIDWLNANDVRIYVFSIDGGPEHNRYRVDWAGRPTWGRVAENLRKLCQTKQVTWLTARASWHCGSNGEDYDLVGRFRALEELGARSIAVVPVTDAPFDERRVEQAYLELGEHYQWGRTPSRYVNEMLERMLRGEENVPQAGDGCGVGTQYWALLPDGRLSLCQEYAEKPEGIIGSIYEGITNPLPFLAISDRVHQFHTAVNPYPKETERYACRRCHAYRHCMGVGWCAGWHRQVTGDEIVPPDGYCAHLRGFVSAMRQWAEEHKRRYPWQVSVMGRTWERATASVPDLQPMSAIAEVDCE